MEKLMQITGVKIEDFDPEKVQQGDLFLVAGFDNLYLARIIERIGDTPELEELAQGVKRSDPARTFDRTITPIDLMQKTFQREFIHITIDSDGTLVLRPSGRIHSHVEKVKLLLSYLASS